MTKTVKLSIVMLGAIATSFAAGYFTRGHLSKAHSSPVNSTWITAARSCWLGLAQKHDDDILSFLSETNNFRATFPKYVTLDDDHVRKLFGGEMAITFMHEPDCRDGVDMSAGYSVDKPAEMKSMYLAKGDPRICKSEDPYAKYGGHLSHEWFCDVSTGQPLKAEN